MKGIIFTSFISFVEKHLGEDFVDRMLSECPLPSAGAYTNVGTYSVDEILIMMDYVFEHHDLDIVAVQRQFGEHTFNRLAERYPHLVDIYDNAFDCIVDVDQNIHKNVRKLYPEAELPDLHAERSPSGRLLTLNYESSRPFMHIAYGLLQGCLGHYNSPAEISMTDLSKGIGTHASFRLVRHD